MFLQFRLPANIGKSFGSYSVPRMYELVQYAEGTHSRSKLQSKTLENAEKLRTTNKKVIFLASRLWMPLSQKERVDKQQQEGEARPI